MVLEYKFRLERFKYVGDKISNRCLEVVFERVVTTRSVGECINSADRALRNLGSAKNSNNDRGALEYYDILNTWCHNLGSALLTEWTAKAERVKGNFRARAQRIGPDAAYKEAKALIEFYKKLAESFSNSEKICSFASGLKTTPFSFSFISRLIRSFPSFCS